MIWVAGRFQVGECGCLELFPGTADCLPRVPEQGRFSSSCGCGPEEKRENESCLKSLQSSDRRRKNSHEAGSPAAQDPKQKSKKTWRARAQAARQSDLETLYTGKRWQKGRRARTQTLAVESLEEQITLKRSADKVSV